MGAQHFTTQSQGHDVEEAFLTARSWAQYMHGHGGYTGTIAEKDQYTLFEVPADTGVEEFAEMILAASNSPTSREILADLIGEDAARSITDVFNDKWGPAVALQVGEDEWLFCGWASC
jgi:hypothetical protein